MSEALLGSFLGSHLGTILRARVVIGAIVVAGGAAECLEAGGLCERVLQGGLRNKDWGSTGGTLKAGLTGAPLSPPE